MSDFAPSFVKRGNGRCRPCCRRITPGGKAWRATASPEEIEIIRAKASENYQSNRAKRLADSRIRRLAVDYGITPAEYDAMAAAQGHRCACCGSKEPGGSGSFHVDHDHVTGDVRGLLCSKCNLGIGSLGDTVEGVQRALQPFKRTTTPLRINLMARVA